VGEVEGAMVGLIAGEALGISVGIRVGCVCVAAYGSVFSHPQPSVYVLGTEDHCPSITYIFPLSIPSGYLGYQF
jgi:hypothetical protein